MKKEANEPDETSHRFSDSWTWVIRAATGQWVVLVQTGPVNCAIGSLEILATGSQNDMLKAQKILGRLTDRVLAAAVTVERAAK